MDKGNKSSEPDLMDTPLSFYMDPTVSHPGPLGKKFIPLSDYTMGYGVGFNSSESKKSAAKFGFGSQSSEEESKKSVAISRPFRLSKSKVSGNYIPDVGFSILFKLPIKSLKRFACVCKSWSTLFENSRFKTMYSNRFISRHGSHDHYHTFILTNILTNIEEEIREYNFHTKLHLLDNGLELKLPPTFKHPICILGNTSVKGIFCFGQGWPDKNKVQYMLSNPVTQEFLVIPPSPVELEPHYPQTRNYLDHVFHGFGYDQVRDDFKVIQYVSLLSKDGCFVTPGSFEIYSLKSNSWRTMHIEVDISWIFQDPFSGWEVYMNGACHWLVMKFFPGQHIEMALLSFDLSHEEFLTTPIGEELYPNFYEKLLTVLNGSIALISNHDDKNIFVISILGELGVSESWIKLYTYGPLPFIQWPPIAFGKTGYMFFIKKDELADDDELVDDPGGEVAYVDLSSRIIKEVGITLTPGSDFAVGLYKESLVGLYKESLVSMRGSSN